MTTRPAKESVLNLNKYLDQGVRVKFSGGREVTGVLKGFDSLLNLVLDETVEDLRDPNDFYTLSGKTRNLGLTMLRGTSVLLIMPTNGSEQLLHNPFVNADDIQIE